MINSRRLPWSNQAEMIHEHMISLQCRWLMQNQPDFSEDKSDEVNWCTFHKVAKPFSSVQSFLKFLRFVNILNSTEIRNRFSEYIFRDAIHFSSHHTHKHISHNSNWTRLNTLRNLSNSVRNILVKNIITIASSTCKKNKIQKVKNQ